MTIAVLITMLPTLILRMNIMKKLALSLSIAALASSSAFAGNFNNGGFENGTLSGWTGGGGTWNNAGSQPAPVNPVIYNGGPANNTIVHTGIDAITGANTVYNGNSAVRVNDSKAGSGVSTLRQSVTNYTDSGIFFAWNAVLQNSHGPNDSDYFSLTLHDDTTNTDIVSRAYSSAGSIGAGTSGVTWTNHNNWYTSGWVVESIDLFALGAIGHDFTLTVLSADCAHNGHAGYAYLDGFGNALPPAGVPEPASLLLMGFGAAGLAFARRRKAI
jgi:hypothetical protein